MDDCENEGVRENLSNGYVTRALDFFSVDDRIAREQSCIAARNHSGEPETFAATFADMQLHTSCHPPPAHPQTWARPQATNEYHGAASAELCRGSKLQTSALHGRFTQVDGTHSPANIDPDILLMSQPLHNQTIGSTTELQEYVGEQHQAEHSSGYIWQCRKNEQMNGCGGNHAVGGSDEYQQMNGASADYEMYPQFPYTPSDPCATDCSRSTVGPNNFLPAVLGRQDDHQEVLGRSTARLLDRLGMTEMNVSGNSAGGNFWVTGQRFSDDPMLGNELPIVAPQPPSAIEARQPYQYSYRGPAEGFRYTVRPGTPVLAGQRTSNPCSG